MCFGLSLIHISRIDMDKELKVLEELEELELSLIHIFPAPVQHRMGTATRKGDV